MVTNLDPAVEYYFGRTDILLDRNTVYEFQLLSFEGEIKTENDAEDIVRLEPPGTGILMIA